MSPSLPTARTLLRKLIVLGAAVATAGLFVVALYLVSLLQLPRAEWPVFATLVVGLAVLLGVVVGVANQRLHRPLLRCLEAEAAGEATLELRRAGFAAAVNLPLRTFLIHQIWWTLGGVLLGAGMRIAFGQFSLFSVAVIVAATASVGLLAMLAQALCLKRVLEPVREALAARVGEASERGELVRRVSLAGKLRVAVTGVTAVPVVFAVFLAQAWASRPIEALVGQLEGRWVQEAAARLGGASVPSAELASRARASGVVHAWAVVGLKTGKTQAGQADALTASERAWMVREAAQGAQTGSGRGVSSAHVFVWRRIPGTDRAVVASSPWSAWNGGLSGLDAVLVVLVLASVGVALGVAGLVAQDVGRATEVLRGEAERLASGDLRPGRLVESEDELGELGRAFARMGEALRATVGRVAHAADGVEAAAREMESLGEGVAGVTADQVRGIEEAGGSTEAVRGQVAGITDSAQSLSASVEESSSSILELGAAGEELNQTASVLSGQVEDVSSSIEEMIRSVRQVAGNAESLAEAAAETSSSMEEMAASMREVDTNASETARLSARVVEVSERGREQVRETIVGMEAIREATETAEGVIRGLGARTQEIGAILDVIDDVADETNLLALNAAIIAAQAGEHGRAFSVVADEIKELADRVMASTKEIGTLIRAVQDESQAAVGAVERGSASVLAGVDRSAEAGVSLEEITRTARTSGERIAQIVEAVREQTKAAAHVAELMEQVRTGVEHIRGATREQERGNEVVLRGTVTMREVAQQVHRTTEEQARGSGQIREGIEIVREAVARIHQALQEQSTACQQTVAVMEHVAGRTRANEDVVRRMENATRALRQQAQSLRTDVQRFQI